MKKENAIIDQYIYARRLSEQSHTKKQVKKKYMKDRDKPEDVGFPIQEATVVERGGSGGD